MSPLPLPEKYPLGFPPPHLHNHGPHNAITEGMLDFLYWLFKSRSYPRPHTTDWYEESAAIAHFLNRFWHILLILMGTVFGVILFLVVTIRCCMLYDRYQAKHGEVGTELSTREDAMVRACERRGEIVLERMEKERMERIWREEDKRQAVREEHLRRKSILQGKLPVMEMMRIEEERVGSGVVPGVGEGPAPRNRPGSGLERKKSKRVERRGEGTQVLSEEEDTLRKGMGAIKPRGAEAKIGNSVWRSASHKGIQRANSVPERFYGAGSFKELTRSVPMRGTGHTEFEGEDEAKDEIITNDAGLTDTRLETEIPELPRLSFDVDRKEVLCVQKTTVQDTAAAKYLDCDVAAQTNADVRTDVGCERPLTNKTAQSPKIASQDTPYHSMNSANSGDPYSSEHVSEADEPLLGAPVERANAINTTAAARASIAATRASVGSFHERIMLPRLSFELPGSFSPVGISGSGDGEVDRGREEEAENRSCTHQ